jgi:cytochrome c oxidase cbb3-type subunit III
VKKWRGAPFMKVAAATILIGLGGALGFGGCHPAAADDSNEMKNPYEGDPAAIAKGEDLFAERCSFCHGGHGKGGKGPALTAGHFKRSGTDTTLFSTIIAGRPGTQMGSFANTLSADDVWDIIAFLRAETKKREAAGELTPQ